jgi:hypothetical protein
VFGSWLGPEVAIEKEGPDLNLTLEPMPLDRSDPCSSMARY